MKITLLGYGKMGKQVEDAANERGHKIIAKIDEKNPIQTMTSYQLKDTDIFIDFSDAECVVDHVTIAGGLGINLVMGTTGWENKMNDIRDTIDKSGIGFFWAPNFSVGVNLFSKIIEAAARLMNNNGYDVAIQETHHRQKSDSPSGTAKSLANLIISNIDEKEKIVTEPPKEVSELHVGSLRCGGIPGTHSIVFNSGADNITITHQAHNREGFAVGAIDAAEWLVNKKGFFTIKDMMEDLWKN